MNINAGMPRRLALFHSVAAIACLASLLSLAAPADDPRIITSASKQFVVRGQPQRSAFTASVKEDVVYLDPALLVVACERVKHTLTQELGWGQRWHGTIFINIHPLLFDNQATDIQAIHTADGWRYRVEMPDEIERTRLLETIVEVLLLEFANRGATAESPELPPWLVGGLTAHLMQGPLAGLTLQARTLRELSEEPALRKARTRRPSDTNGLIRKRVQGYGALSVDQLNWPEFDANDAASAEAYRNSASLFVRELLRLRGGPDCLCATLAKLPEHLNWQTAFLRGFEPHFRRMLDVEKWWSLSLTQLKTHDNAVTWATAEALEKLDEILYTPMQVRLTKEEMPHVTPVAIQTVISDWDFKQQVALLQAKLVQLQAARLRLPAELSALAESYRAAIEKYLHARGTAWFSVTGQAAARGAIEQLNALDGQRAKITGKVLTAAVPDARGPVPLTPP